MFKFKIRARKDLQITHFYLDPFVGLACRDQRLGVTNSWLTGSAPASVVSVPIMMAALILFIACFNFTNTSIAVFSKRLKEIGIRKVMGSKRKAIIIQFLGETFFFCFLSLIVALVMTKFLIIWYNDLWTFLHLEINYIDNPEIIIFLVILLTISGLLSGGYPAFYISKFEPTSILKGTLRFGGINIFVRMLLTLQFTLSLIAIVFAVAFVNNAKFQKNMDMGYDMDGIIYLKVSSANDYNNYRNKLLQNKSIQMIVGTKGHIFSSVASIPVKFESVTKDVKLIDAGENYINAMELEIIQGRDFIDKSESDRAEAILINEEFARVFGLQEPLGKQILLMDSAHFYVVGVVKDFYLDGIWETH